VFDYEIQMYFETRNLLKHLVIRNPNDIVNIITKNATVESQLLHTRIMTDILISKSSREDDDITLKILLPDWCNSENGKSLIEKLKITYGKQNEKDSPCWILNKMLAHPTRWRTDQFDYGKPMKQIEPIIFQILSEVEKIANRPVLTYYIKSSKS